MSAAIVLENINLSFGNSRVLTDVSARIDEGEFFVIIGPNGAGKTCLLKVISGVKKAQSGRIEIFGRPITEYSRRQVSQVVAVVPQYLSIDFPFTVAETVIMGRSPHLGLVGLEQQRDFEIAEQAMVFTDVAHLAARRLDQLSGGELQRVVIARAICQQPRIILLDEPTAALDPAHQLNIMDLMERFRRENNTTVVMVSHDLNLAAMYGDRLLLLKDGIIETIGTPSEVLSKDQLEKSYGCDIHVDKSRLGGVPHVTLVPEKFQS